MKDRMWKKPIYLRGIRGAAFVVALSLSIALLGCVRSTTNKEKAPRERLVLFKFEGQFKTVCLGGDFNGWTATSHCLTKEKDTWQIGLYLFPGRYAYGFILDGARWIPDPNAPFQEDDGFGRRNSVLVVD